MKRVIALMFIPALMLAGCSRPVVKETVVERPVVVPAPVVTSPAAAGSTAGACVYQAQSYTHGARSCQQSAEWVCTNGAWQRTNNPC